jgi:hypothetical protein
MISNTRLNTWTQVRQLALMPRKCVERLFRSLSRCPHPLNIPMQIWALGAGSFWPSGAVGSKASRDAAGPTRTLFASSPHRIDR